MLFYQMRFGPRRSGLENRSVRFDHWKLTKTLMLNRFDNDTPKLGRHNSRSLEFLANPEILVARSTRSAKSGTSNVPFFFYR